MFADILDKALVVSGPVLDGFLCAAILLRNRWRSFPALLAFALLDLVSSPLLYWVDPGGTSRLYTRLYVGYDVCSFLLQLLILYDVARNVLKPGDAWDARALRALTLLGISGVAIALAATIVLQPTEIHGTVNIFLRAEVFSSLLTCELVIGMMLSATKVGLTWRSHVMAVGQGLMLWALVVASEEGLYAHVGPNHPFGRFFYYARVLDYLVVVGYWTVSLWNEEPARRPTAPALRKYIVALHEQVQYDLGNTGH